MIFFYNFENYFIMLFTLKNNYYFTYSLYIYQFWVFVVDENIN